MTQRAGRCVRAPAVLLALVVASACRSTTPSEIEMDVRNVGFDHDAGAPVVILQARGGGPILPIWIGPAEAQSIAMELQKVAAPRPMTHDLVKRILDSAGMALRRVRITDLQHETFFAMLVLDRDGREIEIDSRPSDAIALALRSACPILVSRTLLDRAGAGGGTQRGVGARVWGLTVQDLTPALAESLGVEGSGVLVSDAAPLDASADGPRRGDVIVAVDGRPIATVNDLATAAQEGGARARVEVRRDRERVVLRFAPPRAD